MGTDTLRGIALMVLGMFGFAVADTFLKLTGGVIPPGQIVVIIGVSGVAICLPLALASGARDWRRNACHPMVLLRSFAEGVGSVCFASALLLAPLSTVSAIGQANTLVVTLGAALWLKQPVGPHRWGAVIVGLIGVMIVIQPWREGVTAAALLACLAVLGLAVRDLSTRQTPAAIGTLQLSVYGLLALIPAGLLQMMAMGTPLVAPDGPTLWVLTGMVAFLPLGYVGTAAAMRVGEIAAVTPFRYTRIVFALLLGIAVFGERPGLATYLGAGLIVLSGCYTLWRENLRRRG